ncbi:hypothetical protein F5Y17DRAFT_425916 [Xylariaceae sp. FL0594]|nr:hypothetical protein F5Y17DRAFT_425916 [Xylariaceae sp. FL0594]
MHIFKSIVLYAANAAALGFTIPEGQPDGVYAVSYDAHGVPVHHFVSGPVEESVISPYVSGGGGGKPFLHARQTDARKCEGHDLDHSNTDAAVEALKRQCDPAGAVGGGLDFYSVAGNTVAYLCNYASTSVACTRNLLTDSYAAITANCGLYRSGWRDLTGGNYRYSIGYEPYGNKFCGRGTN